MFRIFLNSDQLLPVALVSNLETLDTLTHIGDHCIKKPAETGYATAKCVHAFQFEKSLE